MNNLYQYKYSIISIAIHLIILITFSLNFDLFTVSKKLGNIDSVAISSFIYQGENKRLISSQEKKELKSATIKATLANTSHASHSIKIQKKKMEETTKKHMASQNSLSQGEPASVLIGLLHDAIQRKQSYPPNAWEMQRQGRVTVAFDLYEDGHIANLRVMGSSGTSSLDKAAIQAVSDAAPFNELSSYIKNTQEYKIDIVFELS